ncbi:MAG TPA: glycosyltransferase [Candidatus Paceibacterota bacterium]|nr:glycosyltransferase [Candidatus Paceibacterota bacterium]
MAKKTKILYFITKGNFGGAQRYVYDLATNLPKNDFDIVVIFGEGQILRSKLASSGIRTKQIGSLKRDVNIFADLSSLWQIWKILIKERPDVIHLNSSKIGGIGALAGRLAGVKKIIFTVHGLASNEDRPEWQKILIKFSHWLSMILCHEIITVSDSLRKIIINWPGLKAKVSTIHNGIIPVKLFERSIARKEILSNHHDQSKDSGRAGKFWIGTISELHKNKGLDFLIEAFASTVRTLLGNSLGWSLNLIIISDGEEKARLEKLIKDKRMEDRIFLAGRIEDARSYLKAFDIFTLTSRTEALPYSLLEAGLAGLPVIASEVGGIPEIITNPEQGILVPVGNIEEIKKSLLFMIKKPQYRKLAGANLKHQIQTNFSLKQMLNKTIRLYNN